MKRKLWESIWKYFVGRKQYYVIYANNIVVHDICLKLTL